MSLFQKIFGKSEGSVEEMVCGGSSKSGKFVIGNKVYETVCGGPCRVVGYVKDGVAYEIICGGQPRVIGKVKYNHKEHNRDYLK